MDTLIFVTYFDTHFHLDSLKELPDEPNLEGMDIGCEPDDINRRIDGIRKYNLHFSIAAGPWCLNGQDDICSLCERIRKNISDWKPDMLGETGIDFHWNYGRKGQMEELFDGMLTIAEDFNLPLVVHSRDAHEATVSVLREHSLEKRGIIHCFSYDRKSAAEYLDLGLMISFAGNVTYKSNEELREAAVYVPDDSILLETDSPYLAPIPLRGKANVPANIRYTYEFVAGLRRTTAEALNSLVKQNYMSML